MTHPLRSLFLLPALLGLVRPAVAGDSEHFEISTRGGTGGLTVRIEGGKAQVVEEDKVDYNTFCEAVYAEWRRKIGPKAEPTDKFKVEIINGLEDYEKEAPKGTSWHDKSGTLLVLGDGRVLNSLASGTTLLYLSRLYPKMAAREELPAWIAAGIADYFGSMEWKDGKLLLDSSKVPEVSGNALSLIQLNKLNDWLAFDKGFKLTSKEWARSRGIITLQGWAVYYYLFNFPGDGGGQGTGAASVQEFFAALEAGQKPAAALDPILKNLKVSGLGGLESSIKQYLPKVGVEVADREEKDFWVGETAHYTIRVQKGSDNKKLKMDAKAILKDMKFKMELLFTKYAQAFAFNGKLSRRPQMRLYSNKDNYVRQGGGSSSSAAYYRPSTKELVGYEDSAESNMVFQIFCHEGCHQFFDLAFPGFYDSDDLPMWFSEGLADCFGASEIRGKDLFIFTLSGVASWRVETIKVAVAQKAHPSLQDLLDMGREPFMADGGLHYAQSWSFCHFLWNYPNLDSGGGQYREVLIKLIEGFKVGKPKAEVYAEAFQFRGKPIAMDQLEREWKDFVRSRLKARR